MARSEHDGRGNGRGRGGEDVDAEFASMARISDQPDESLCLRSVEEAGDPIAVTVLDVCRNR
jgi:hypothetical protein